MKSFITHKNELVAGERLEQALNAVADWWYKNAYGIYEENLYAAHVTAQQKLDNLNEGISLAGRIRNGSEPMGFWLWQRVNTELTGECVAFLPKAEGI
jgi:hypothetical protein